MLYRLVHLLIWISFGALLAMDIIWCTSCYGQHLVQFLLWTAFGALETSAPPKVHALNEKRCINNVDTPLSCSVGGDGFEPPKASPADLQSAPFGHSGNHPIAFVLKASAKVQINFDTTITLHSFFSLSIKTNAKIVKKQLLTL